MLTGNPPPRPRRPALPQTEIDGGIGGAHPAGTVSSFLPLCLALQDQPGAHGEGGLGRFPPQSPTLETTKGDLEGGVSL